MRLRRRVRSCRAAALGPGCPRQVSRAGDVVDFRRHVRVRKLRVRGNLARPVLRRFDCARRVHASMPVPCRRGLCRFRLGVGSGRALGADLHLRGRRLGSGLQCLRNCQCRCDGRSGIDRILRLQDCMVDSAPVRDRSCASGGLLGCPGTDHAVRIGRCRRGALRDGRADFGRDPIASACSESFRVGGCRKRPRHPLPSRIASGDADAARCVGSAGADNLRDVRMIHDFAPLKPASRKGSKRMPTKAREDAH